METVLLRFIGLAVIASIDDYFYHAISERNSKEFVNKFWNEENVCEDDEDEEPAEIEAGYENEEEINKGAES